MILCEMVIPYNEVIHSIKVMTKNIFKDKHLSRNHSVEKEWLGSEAQLWFLLHYSRSIPRFIQTDFANDSINFYFYKSNHTLNGLVFNKLSNSASNLNKSLWFTFHESKTVAFAVCSKHIMGYTSLTWPVHQNNVTWELLLPFMSYSTSPQTMAWEWNLADCPFLWMQFHQNMAGLAPVPTAHRTRAGRGGCRATLGSKAWNRYVHSL